MQLTKGLNSRKGLERVVPRWDTLDNVPSYPSQYHASGFEPVINMDFVNNLYTHELNHSRLSNATMTDSDGLIKWAPHNFLSYSEDFNNAYWTKTLCTVTTGEGPGPFPNTLADRVVVIPNTSGTKKIWNTTDLTPNIPADTEITVGAYFKQGNAYNPILAATDNAGNEISVEFNIASTAAPFGAVTFAYNTTRYSITRVNPTSSAANAWYYCTMTYNVGPAGPSPINVGVYIRSFNSFNTASTTAGFRMFGLHAYRSDLATANHMISGTPYIKSTDSPKFGVRTGHYVDGINEGLLIETGAKTNRIWPSNDFNHANYVKTNIETYTDGTISPSGKKDAYKVINNSNTIDFYTVNSSSSTLLTLSVFIKRGNFDSDSTMYWGLYDTTAGVDLGRFTFNFETQVISGSVTFFPFGVEKYANGWYRLFGIFPNTPNNSLKVICGRSGTSFSTKYHYQYGLQLESALMSSYIPTFVSNISKLADTGINIDTTGVLQTGPIAVSMQGRVNFYKTTGNTAQVQMWRQQSLDGSAYSARINTVDPNKGKPYMVSNYLGTTTPVSPAPDMYTSVIPSVYSITGVYTATNTKVGISGLYSSTSSVAGMGDFLNQPLELGISYLGTIKAFRVWNVDIGISGCLETTK